MLKAKEIINNDEVISLIKPLLKDYKTYLVGGYVRDALLGIQSLDRDLIVETDDLKGLSEALCNSLNAHFVPLDEINNIYRIVLNDKLNHIDITCPIENNLEKDLLRRDLTLNSIAYDIHNDTFIDVAGGISDIENKIIKGISEQNFLDDPLRFLRIYRFYSKLGFKIDKSLVNMTKEHVCSLHKSAKERINTELIKLFEGEFAHDALFEMDEVGLINQIFPIMEQVKKVPQNSHHHLDLFEHSIETVKQIENFYKESCEEVKEYLDENSMGNGCRLAYLKLAAFCHDIGKPSTWTIEEDSGRHRFIKHDDVGSKLVVPILKELKFSKKQISYIQKLIKNHIYPASVVNQCEISEKSQMKFFRKMEGSVIDCIILSIADRLSARGPEITEEIVSKNICGLKNLLNKYFEIQRTIKPLEKLLDGNEIMNILNIKASNELGQIINELKEAQISGDVNNKEEAILFIKKLYLEKSHK